LVVGIERNGKRILYPESDIIFEENDKRIQVIIKEMESESEELLG
jgi:hypothetical protein